MVASTNSYLDVGTRLVEDITGLVNGDTYRIRVRAENSFGPGAWSGWSSNVTLIWTPVSATTRRSPSPQSGRSPRFGHHRPTMAGGGHRLRGGAGERHRRRRRHLSTLVQRRDRARRARPRPIPTATGCGPETARAGAPGRRGRRTSFPGPCLRPLECRGIGGRWTARRCLEAATGGSAPRSTTTHWSSRMWRRLAVTVAVGGTS